MAFINWFNDCLGYLAYINLYLLTCEPVMRRILLNIMGNSEK